MMIVSSASAQFGDWGPQSKIVTWEYWHSALYTCLRFVTLEFVRK